MNPRVGNFQLPEMGKFGLPLTDKQILREALGKKW